MLDPPKTSATGPSPVRGAAAVRRCSWRPPASLRDVLGFAAPRGVGIPHRPRPRVHGPRGASSDSPLSWIGMARPNDAREGRRAPPPRAPPPVLNATLRSLRSNWKFAAICQFLLTFDEALQLDGFQTQVRRVTSRSNSKPRSTAATRTLSPHSRSSCCMHFRAAARRPSTRGKTRSAASGTRAPTT